MLLVQAGLAGLCLDPLKWRLSGLLLALMWRHGLPWLVLCMAVAGLFLLSMLPVVLEWAERHAGPQRQGAATGFLLLGNAGWCWSCCSRG